MLTYSQFILYTALAGFNYFLKNNRHINRHIINANAMSVMYQTIISNISFCPLLIIYKYF